MGIETITLLIILVMIGLMLLGMPLAWITMTLAVGCTLLWLGPAGLPLGGEPGLWLRQRVRVRRGAAVRADGLHSRALGRGERPLPRDARLRRRPARRARGADHAGRGGDGGDDRDHRRRDRAARPDRAAADAAARLRPQARDRHDLRRRLARHDDPALGRADPLRPDRERLDQRPVPRGLHAGRAAGLPLHRLRDAALLARSVARAAGAARGPRDDRAREAGAAQRPDPAAADRGLGAGLDLWRHRLGHRIGGRRRGRRDRLGLVAARAELGDAARLADPDDDHGRRAAVARLRRQRADRHLQHHGRHGLSQGPDHGPAARAARHHRRDDG